LGLPLLSERVVQEIHYEVNLEPSKLTPKSKLVLTLVELIPLGFCGVDRCYMGQTCLGFLKGLSLGGFIVWFMIDWVAVVLTNLSGSAVINAVGYRAKFTDGINSAFWLTFLTLIIMLLSLALAAWSRTHRDDVLELVEDCSIFDKDGTGYVSKEVFKQVVMENGFPITDEQVNALFGELDTAKSGRVSIKALAQILAAT